MSRRVLLSLLLTLLVLPTGRAQGAPDPTCFPNITGVTDCLQGRFAEYWNMNGGLSVFGYPITPTYDVITPTQVVLSQVVERNRLEYHPELRPPFDILLGRLGIDVLRVQDRDWQREAPGQPQSGCWYAEVTRHNVCDQAAGEGFLSFYRSHGLELGDPGISEGEALSLWGYPLTEPAVERNAAGDVVLTQWFERARFEYHPQNAPGSRVVLGLLGRELYDSGPRPNPTTRPIPAGIGTPMPDAGSEQRSVADSSGTVSSLFSMINNVHQQNGCGSLRYDTTLATAGQRHAEDIARAKRIDHTGSDGATLRTRLDRVQYPYVRASENIAVYPTPEDVFRVWMGDAPNGIHRVNMTSCTYTEAGIGRALDNAGGVWWVLVVADRQNTP
jgi:uncharacterized protein YkwD